jgi:hypothetical protein
MFEDAVQLTPEGHPEKPSRLSNLGISLSCCFQHSGNLNDLNKSILMFEDAVQLTPEGHPDMPSRLSNLGNSLLSCFEHLGNVNDLNKSILMKEDAVQLTPEGHPQKPSRLITLSDSLLSSSICFNSDSDFAKCGLMCEEAAKSNTGPFSTRFHACSCWALFCQVKKPHLVLDAYSLAFHLLPNMAWLGLSIMDRQHSLMGAGAVVQNAVAAAIHAGQYETAVEWMDQGHSVIWGQLLQLRTPVDDLKQLHPDLADQFTMLSKKLEGANISDFDTIPCSGHQSPNVKTSEDYHEIVDKWHSLIQQIRQMKGFDRFLLPQKFSQLQVAASNGPVISINVSKNHCDALILTPDRDDILHIPLNQFTLETTEALSQCLTHLVGHSISHEKISEPTTNRNNIHSNHLDMETLFRHMLSQISDGLSRPTRPGKTEQRATRPAQSSSNVQTFQDILEVLWCDVVKPILDGLAFSVSHFET